MCVYVCVCGGGGWGGTESRESMIMKCACLENSVK